MLGDSLMVMASLLEKERLGGQVQTILCGPSLRHRLQLQLSTEGYESDGEERCRCIPNT